MASRSSPENSRYRLETLRAKASKGPQTWQQYRSQLRDHISSPPRIHPTSLIPTPAPRSSLGSMRNPSPLQKYRSNPSLFYQTLNSPHRASSPSSYSSFLSTSFLRSRNELNVSGTTAVLKRRLNDVLKLEALRKAQDITSEMTAEDVARLPSGYTEALAQTLDLILRKVRSP